MNLFLLGSCRIHRPIRKLHNLKKVNFLNYKDPCWFMHTARAARQSLEIILGNREPPIQLRELIFETNNDREIIFKAPQKIANSDALIVEICTLSSINIDGWEANSHRVSRAEKAGDIRVSEAKKTKVSAQDISEEITKISYLSKKPVVVVNHIAKTGIIEVDKAREKLTNELKLAQKIVNFNLFDTSIVLEKFSTEEALVDRNHYKSDFELVIGKALFSFVKNIIAEE